MEKTIGILFIIVLFSKFSHGQPPINLSSFWNDDGSSKFENYKLDSIIGAKPDPFWANFLSPFYKDVIVEYSEDCTIKSLFGISHTDLPLHQFKYDNGLISQYLNVKNEHTTSGKIVEDYLYNANGQLIYEEGSGGPSVSENWVHEWEYDTIGRLTEMSKRGEVDNGGPSPYAYNYIECYKYDSLNQITQAIRLSSDRRDTLRLDSYVYNKDLLVTEIVWQGAQREDTIRYEYDNMDRLVKKYSFDFTWNKLAPKLEEYTYSSEGNLVEHIISHEVNNEFIGTIKTNYFFNSDNLEVGLEDYRFTEGEWRLVGNGEKRYNEDGLLTYELREKEGKEFHLYYSKKSCTTSTFDDVMDVVISPNPSSKVFTLKNEHYNIKHMELFDINGTQMLSREVFSEKVIFGNNLLPGIYFLVLGDTKGTFKTEKLIKQ